MRAEREIWQHAPFSQKTNKQCCILCQSGPNPARRWETAQTYSKWSTGQEKYLLHGLPQPLTDCSLTYKQLFLPCNLKETQQQGPSSNVNIIHAAKHSTSSVKSQSHQVHWVGRDPRGSSSSTQNPNPTPECHLNAPSAPAAQGCAHHALKQNPSLTTPDPTWYSCLVLFYKNTQN